MNRCKKSNVRIFIFDPDFRGLRQFFILQHPLTHYPVIRSGYQSFGNVGDLNTAVTLRNERFQPLDQNNTCTFAGSVFLSVAQQKRRTGDDQAFETKALQALFQIAFGTQVKIGTLGIGAHRRDQHEPANTVFLTHSGKSRGVFAINAELRLFRTSNFQGGSQGAKHVIATDFIRIRFVKINDFDMQFRMCHIHWTANEGNHPIVGRMIEQLLYQLVAYQTGSAKNESCFHELAGSN